MTNEVSIMMPVTERHCTLEIHANHLCTAPAFSQSSVDANESTENGDICNEGKIPLLSHQKGSEN